MAADESSRLRERCFDGSVAEYGGRSLCGSIFNKVFSEARRVGDRSGTYVGRDDGGDMAVDEVLRVSEDGLQKGEATESADEGPEVDDVVWLCLRRG